MADLKGVVFKLFSSPSEIGGKKASANPNREIGFGFVSCSCRACVRSCVIALGRCPSTLGPRTARAATPAVGDSFDVLMTVTWVLRCFSWEACYTHGLFDQYCDILVICMGFKLLCCLFVRC